MKRVNRVDSAALLTFFFTALLFFYDLFGARYLLTERDLGPYFIPPRFFWVESIKRGDFPLWNPYQFCGHPFFANPQYAICYPLNSLFLLLPFDSAFNSIIIIHFFLGGVFTYLLLRDLAVDPAARKQGRDDLERRVLGGGADEDDAARLDVGQEGILLGLVEPVNLVHEEDRTAAVHGPLKLGPPHDFTDFGDRGSHRG